jgi:hypothetical protein
MLDAMSDHSLRPDSIVVAGIAAAPISQQLVHNIIRDFGVHRVNVCILMYPQSAGVTFFHSLQNLENGRTALDTKDYGVPPSLMEDDECFLFTKHK